MCVQQERLQNLAADGLEASLAVVRAGAAAAPVSSVLVVGAAEVKRSLVHHLRVAASNELRVPCCNESKNETG